MKKRILQFLIAFLVVFLMFTGCEQTLLTTPGPLTITFDKNDADATGTMEDQVIESGSLVDLRTNGFTKTGWSFAGWAVTSTGDVLYADEASYTIGTEDTTLYAIWTESPFYTVIYDGNGNDSGTVPGDGGSYEKDATVTVLGNTGTLAKTDYTFVGWNTAEDGSGINYQEDSTFIIGAGNIILYANWTILPTYSVIYDANSATGGTVPAAQTKTEGIDLTLAINSGSLVRTGYNFAGWNTADDGSGTDYAEGATYNLNAALTLFVKWGAYYTSANIGSLVYVPAGSFQRDSTSTNISVITTAFGMSEHEITRDQFSTIMGADPSNETYSNGTSDPVQMVNWYHVIAFCNKLSIAEGLTQVYSVDSVDFSSLAFSSIPTSSNSTWDAATANWSANGYRLPTEMEWMWAAMGATNGSGYEDPRYLTGYGKLFAGSNSTLADGSGGTNDIGDYAWYLINSASKTHPVGTTGTTSHANELGLYDMSGNVWEWNWDWYAVYPTGTIYSNTDDGRGAASGTERVLRGGSWDYNASGCTVANRYYCAPFVQHYEFGFRVVRP